MLFENRAELILDILAKEHTVSIQKLVEQVEASESTIRRDLISLEESGQLRRIHGGATSVNELKKEQKMSQKENLNLEAKKAVAKHAAHLVQPNTQIYVDAGTATLELIRLLPQSMDIQIVTNGIDQALLAIQRGIPVNLLGGSVKPNTHAIAGITAYQQLEKMNFSHAFMGMNGIHEESGLTTTNIEEALLKELAMKQSQNIRILMDDSKVNEVYEFKVDIPTQAIILFNERAEKSYKAEMAAIRKIYDLAIVEDEKGKV